MSKYNTCHLLKVPCPHPLSCLALYCSVGEFQTVPYLFGHLAIANISSSVLNQSKSLWISIALNDKSLEESKFNKSVKKLLYQMKVW